MKIGVLLGDGMSGLPLEGQGGRTSLELAKTPHMDRLAREGALGRAVTIPAGYPPGSDVANLSIFGYDPAACYTGRAPLEAAAMGVRLGPDDVAYRMNLVHLLAGTGKIYMDDFTAGHISSEEAAQIVETLQRELGEEGLEFHPGVSYRHLFVWRNGEYEAATTPPHDITGKPIHEHLPSGPGGETLVGLMTGSQILLKGHPVNLARYEAGDKEANSIWLWGQGKAPRMETYDEKYGLTGAVVSAVDLLKGIGVMAGLKPLKVDGATGYLDTNYQGKVDAALGALDTGDFFYLHVEAPDEAAHEGSLEKKVQAIEDFDARVVGPVRAALEARGEPFALLVCPDHPTPVELRTHTRAPIPFICYRSDGQGAHPGAAYDEKSAEATGLYVENGHQLLAHILGKVSLW